MEELEGVPCKVLGYRITTTTQICVSCLVTAILELLVYLVVTFADIGITVQHFREGNQLYGTLTLMFLCLPAIACFCSVIVSPWQWPEEEECGKENQLFFCKQLYNLLLFPIAAIYRLSRRIFWSVEAIFQEEETYERHHAVKKAAEHSSFELYHFLQAFLQAAPQIILQFYILLRDDVFRNYETSHIQIVSIIFSLITMAVITASYQRFESQKVVGRDYPWATECQSIQRKKIFTRTKSVPEEPQREPIYFELPESEHIMKRFKSMDQSSTSNNEIPTTPYYKKKSLHLGEYNLDRSNTFTYNEKRKSFRFSDETNEDVDYNADIDHDQIVPSSSPWQFPNDQNRTSSDINAIVKETNTESIDSSLDEIEEELDYCPQHQAPPPPNIKYQVINRLSTYKDMLFLNAELYIKDHVPRLPASLFDNNEIKEQNTKQPDEIDFKLPTRKKMVEGIEQDDAVGKAVAFTAWVLFLFMRMMALSAFSVFYPMPCVYLCLAHYLLMVFCLFYETKFHEKIERTYFYLFLAYIYIFCILEFKIKFKKPRYWYIGYVTLMLVQNVTITLIWYLLLEYQSWWFDYMFKVIILSFCYCIMCLLVYYFLLKPTDKVLFENET